MRVVAFSGSETAVVPIEAESTCRLLFVHLIARVRHILRHRLVLRRLRAFHGAVADAQCQHAGHEARQMVHLRIQPRPADRSHPFMNARCSHNPRVEGKTAREAHSQMNIAESQ